MRFCTTFAVLLLAVTAPGYAQSDAAQSWRHASEFSLGLARAEGNTEFGLGFEYEYALTERWGIGAALGHTPGTDDYDESSAALALVHLHPTPDFSLSVGAGIERVHGATGDDQQMLFFGIARTFAAGRMSITPSFSLENINGETTRIFEISFAIGFQNKPSLSMALAREST